METQKKKINLKSLNCPTEEECIGWPKSEENNSKRSLLSLKEMHVLKISNLSEY